MTDINFSIELSDAVLEKMGRVLELDEPQIAEYAAMYILQHGLEDWRDEEERVTKLADELQPNLVELKR